MRRNHFGCFFGKFGMQYNEQQMEAVNHGKGPMMVLAGPGCGKTAVITGRLEQLLRSGVPPSEILVVTFTRAAAAEMKTRFLAAGCTGAARVTFGTFHGVYYQILRREYRLDGDAIVGEEKKLQLLKTILEGCCRDAFFEQELAKNVAQEISSVKANGIASRNFYSAVLPAETFHKVFAEYRRWLSENRKLDFDDINTAVFRLFKEKPEALEKWQARFSYLLVDEFQDINPLQYRILAMLAAPQNNLFIVGDDDQSVYRFRGSEPSLMLDFPKRWPGCKTVQLKRNYRSTPQILSAAQLVIGENRKRFEKELFTKNEAGRAVCVRVFENVWQETQCMAEGIRRTMQAGVPGGRIAVLVRTNFGARSAVERLLSDRIPFAARQEIPCIFDHFIARDLFAYLEIAQGSRRREDFLRIANKPNRYLSRTAFYEPKVCFEHLYSYYEDRQWMWPRLEELERDLAAIRDLPPYGAIQYLRKVTGYEEYLRDYALEKKVPLTDLTDLLEEVMESARPFRSFPAWKEHVAAYRQELRQGRRQAEQEPEENAVQIVTLHGSKGKEYEVVYILDINDGVIPYHKAVQEEEIEEERRLFYVGMTRAAKELNLFAVKERYEKKLEVSPFLHRLTEAASEASAAEQTEKERGNPCRTRYF